MEVLMTSIIIKQTVFRFWMEFGILC